MTTSTTIRPMAYTDMPILHGDWDKFADDRHTHLKRLGNVIYLQPGFFRNEDVKQLQNRKLIGLTAVDSTTDEIMGSCSLWFVGFQPEEVPWTEPGPEPESEIRWCEENAKILAELNAQPVDEARKEANAMIDSLDAMEDKDMKYWQSVLMPPGSKCIVVSGFSVLPQYRHKGVGGALLKWGTDQADRFGVHMWVHSSEAAVKAYSNAGFNVVGELDVDMDKYAPGPPPEGVDVPWGHYIIRYMKRLPKE
ncbi:acyl-CoA N-acyltransferase [Microthyrium microscopicum]|uniref:Acyl-CoA N-acyltransferase n=1 Tax=Microthyrium microscopicum TaxID=703497 RepID=A0A6A6U271_9PEZI|nr:acyl-CoA N-acyltransferase [Microthyrium microscopicum]